MTKNMAVKTKFNGKIRTASLGLKNWLNILSRVFLVMTLLLMSWILLVNFPTVWQVEKIAMVGSYEHVTQMQLAEILSNDEFSSMMTIDLQALRLKIKQIPWVKEIQIRKNWPDTLSFNVEEYQPVALINQQYLIENGRLIKQKHYKNEQPLLQVEIDSTLMQERTELMASIESLRQIQTSLLEHHLNIKKVTISENNNWNIQIENRFLIKLGSQLRLLRVQKFLRIYAAIENKNQVEMIDLRYSNGFAVKLVEPIARLQNG